MTTMNEGAEYTRQFMMRVQHVSDAILRRVAGMAKFNVGGGRWKSVACLGARMQPF